ncbi:hypothetical protein EWB00_006876 [Schistosoma japonicum]|uniref:Uncharacterized protein n=1 Tax=Schistosoma japonicum TaxID=6182 RepID=C1LEM4_SCHJA|nr:hypothetical protein EWB00_006876 [Schistosoma japonicum]CAX73152.1 hypothetical protein [Schistosoma japonicum]
MIVKWSQFIYYITVGLLIFINNTNCIENHLSSDDDSTDMSASKRFLLALPSPKRLSLPSRLFSRYRRLMAANGYRPYSDYVDNDEEDNIFNEDKRFLLGLPPKAEYKRFLLGLPPSRHQKRFILGLPAPTRFQF